MAAARLERTTVDIASRDGRWGCAPRARWCSSTAFMKVYEEGRDDAGGDDEARRLPQISEGEPAEKRGVTPEQHFTQPPPRYTEATLVKKMEELGIGRPSTYASIVTTIQDREYVRKDKNRLIPEDKGRIVTEFLLNFFRTYVGYEFTANLEEELDRISAGEQDYKKVLADFWRDFSAAISETSELRISEVLDKLDAALAPHALPAARGRDRPARLPALRRGAAASEDLALGRLRRLFALSRMPLHPPHRRRRSGRRPRAGPRRGRRGDHPALGPIRALCAARRGDGGQQETPARQPAQGLEPDDMDLEKALKLLSLPREVGKHPDDGEPVEAGIGRYGPFVRHGKLYANLKDPEDVFTIGMNRAVEELAKKAASRGKGRGAGAKPLKELGEHPERGGPVNVMDGRYGPYVKWDKVNATLPKDVDPAEVTMERAVELIAEKAAKSGKGGKAPARKKAAAGK